MQIQSGDGYAQVTVDATNTYKMFGLDTDDSSQSYTDIEYALYLKGDGLLYVYESGLNKQPNANGLGPYAIGDVLRVSVEYDVALGRQAVKYYRNSALLYTSSVTPTYPLRLDTSINSPRAWLKDAFLCGNLAPVPANVTSTTANSDLSEQVSGSSAHAVLRKIGNTVFEASSHLRTNADRVPAQRAQAR